MRLLASLGALAIATIVGAHSSSKNVIPLRRRLEPRTYSSTVNVTSTRYAIMFDAEIVIGGQSFSVLLDTGSSDLWLLQEDWRCINSTDDQELSQSACTYGNSTYTPSPTFKRIHNETFGVQYGEGIAVGSLGYEDVTFGGIQVQRQIMGFVNSTTNPGSGIDEGILGLGYKSLTSAHAGPVLTDNSTLLFNRTLYNPLIWNMARQGSIPPWFSMALDRLPANQTTGHGGYLGLGELPPVDFEDEWAVKDVEITNTIPSVFTSSTTEITEWTLTVDGIVWGPGNSTSAETLGSNTTAFQAVVDSGQPANLFPAEVVDRIHAAFSPPVIYDEVADAYLAPCNAIAPRLGVQIGNLTFWHHPEDLLIKLDVTENLCESALAPTASVNFGGATVSLNFLGDAFLRNVVAVFDFGNDTMRFAARTGSNATRTGSRASATGSVVGTSTASVTATVALSTSRRDYGNLGGLGFSVVIALVMLL